jgi:hypothetical protein
VQTAPVFPTIDVSVSKLVPPLKIVAESEDQRSYKIELMTPFGVTQVMMRSSLFTPLQNGNLTIMKADVVNVLE